jgi:hypothetical protein
MPMWDPDHETIVSLARLAGSRTRLPENIAASVSLPLDIGAVTDTIPVHLRRAVTARDRHCRFPG